MSEKIIFDFELNTGGSQRSIKEINDRIKQLTTELKKADIGSKTFNDLNRELAATRVQAKNISQEFKNLELEVKIDTLPSENSILGLQNSLKLLKDEIKGVDLGSDEYKRLEGQIANINIEMKGVKEGLRGLDFGAVLGEAGGVLSGIAGAAGMLNDALMDGNEESAKYIENATRTIMVMQGVQGVMGGVDSATKLLNVTMEKNPIMIWVAAAAALVGGLIVLIKYLNTTNEATSSFNKLSKEQQASVRKTVTEYTRYRLELAQTNGNLRQQLILQEDLRKQEFQEEIRGVAEAFDVESEAIQNATKNYTDYETNLERIKALRNDLKNNLNAYAGATEEERKALLASRREINSSILSLQNQNTGYIKLYGNVDKFKELNAKMAKEEAIFNDLKRKDYENTFKTILDKGTSAYDGLRSAYQSMVESLKSQQESIERSIADVAMRRLEEQIEEAKKLGNIEEVIRLEKLKLETEINNKIKERKKVNEEIIKIEKEGQLAIKEANHEAVMANKELQQLFSQMNSVQNQTIEFNKEAIRLADLSAKAYEDGNKALGDSLQIEAQKAIMLQKQSETQQEQLVNQVDLKRENIDYNKEQVKYYENELKQLKTTSLLAENRKALDAEILELQRNQNKSQKEFIAETIRSIKEYSSTIQDELNNKQLANYEKFLNDTKQLLFLTEQEKNDKASEISMLRISMERKLIQMGLKDNLAQFELYLKDVYKAYGNNFDEISDVISKDPKMLGDAIELVTDKINNQRMLLLENIANNKGDINLQSAKLDLLDNQKDIVEGIFLKTQELSSLNNDMGNIFSKNTENLKIYEDELKRINDAQRAANEKEIEDTLRIISLGKEKMNALMAIEQMKLELYEGSVKKETEATKKQLLIRKDLEESAAMELYEKKIITHEQYLEQIDLIDELHRKRQAEADRMAWKQSLEIAQVLYEGFFTTITNRQNEILNQRLTNIDTEKNRAIQSQNEQAENGLITQEQYIREKDRIELESEEQKRKLQREQAQKDRQYAVFQAILNTAVGIAKAIPNPFQMALAGATGAAQVAAASSTPIPVFEQGGIIGGRRHNQGGTIIEAEKDEIILKRGVRMNPALNNMASMINEAVGGNSFRLPMSSGSSGSMDKQMIQNIVTATVSGVKSIPVINVATETQKVNTKVTRLQNKAKL